MVAAPRGRVNRVPPFDGLSGVAAQAMSAANNRGSTAMLTRFALLLLLATLAGCAGGYTGPPETHLTGERSHGHP